VDIARRAPVWRIFDNTATGAALRNAFRLLDHLRTRHTYL